MRSKRLLKEETVRASAESIDFTLLNGPEIRVQTFAEFGSELRMLVNMLEHMDHAFGAIGHDSGVQGQAPTRLMLALCTRSFHPARHAFKLLLVGAYTQAFMPIRHLHEDELTFDQMIADPKVLE